MEWSEPTNELTVTHQEGAGAGEDQGRGQITASLNEWLEIVVEVLTMMPGKPNEQRDGFLLCPVGTDPAMIGALVATKLKELGDI